MQAELAAEEERLAAVEIKKGEEEAMRVAIEERRRIKLIAEEKKERESRDVEFAKASILKDIDEKCQIEELCSKDEEVAQQVFILCSNLFYYGCLLYCFFNRHF